MSIQVVSANGKANRNPKVSQAADEPRSGLEEVLCRPVRYGEEERGDMRDLEDEARIKAYMAAKMAHIKMYNECMNLADGLDVEKFAELVRADEREACAKLVEADGLARGNEGLVFIKAAGRIRARGEK
jgi:hypothetical protein